MRRFAILMLVVSLGTPSAAFSQTQTAASLLALHRQYVGWTFGDGTFTTLRETGTLTTDGNPPHTYPFARIEMGAIYRTTQPDPQTGETFDNGFTGRVFWESDENGFTRPDYSQRQNFYISESVLLDEGTSELAGTLEPSVTIDGKTYPVVRVTPPNGDPMDLAVDPTTGAYVRAVIDPAGPYETTYDIVAYGEPLPGKRMISKYRLSFGTVAVTRFEPNATIPIADFHPPQQRAAWDFANSQPFRIYVKAHAIFVDASINGIPGRFLLDTGAAGIYVDNAFADRAHLATLENTSSSGIGPNEVRTRIRRAASVTIGGNTLSNVLIDTATFNLHEDDEAPDGLIGYPLFAGAIVTLSTQNQTMQIQDPQTTNVDQSQGAAMRLDLTGGLPVVPMVIDHRWTANALLDTGNGGLVALSQALVSRDGIPIMAHAYTGNAFYHPEDPTAVGDYINSHVVECGVGGCETEACSTVDSIALGPIVYQSTYACISPSLSGNTMIVGYDFLKNFDYVFDYHEGILILKPHTQ